MMCTPSSPVGAGLPAMRPVQAPKLSALLKHLLGPLLNLLLSQVLFTGSQKPEMPIGILQGTGTVAVKLILDLGHHGATRVDRLFVGLVHMGYIHMQAHRR